MWWAATSTVKHPPTGTWHFCFRIFVHFCWIECNSSVALACLDIFLFKSIISWERSIQFHGPIRTLDWGCHTKRIHKVTGAKIRIRGQGSNLTRSQKIARWMNTTLKLIMNFKLLPLIQYFLGWSSFFIFTDRFTSKPFGERLRSDPRCEVDMVKWWSTAKNRKHPCPWWSLGLELLGTTLQLEPLVVDRFEGQIRKERNRFPDPTSKTLFFSRPTSLFPETRRISKNYCSLLDYLWAAMGTMGTVGTVGTMSTYAYAIKHRQQCAFFKYEQQWVRHNITTKIIKIRPTFF